MKIEKLIMKNITDKHNWKKREGNTNPTPKSPQPMVTVLCGYFMCDCWPVSYVYCVYVYVYCVLGNCNTALLAILILNVKM